MVMIRSRPTALRALNLIFCLTVFCFRGSFTYAQLMYTDLEARVTGLPTLMAKSHDPSDVLLTSLDTILHDRSICCGKDSALEDSLERADPLSLKDIASKLQGRHLLSDGRPIVVTTQFWPTEAIDGLRLVSAFNEKHALLMVWNSHLYVVCGVVYRWVEYSAHTGPYTVVRKLQLLDTRYSDSRRELEFDRQTDDPSNVQGMLLVTFAPQ